MVRAHYIGFGRVASCSVAFIAALTGCKPGFAISASDICQKQEGEALDLKPLVDVLWCEKVPPDADLYVVTAGVSRNNFKSKYGLFAKNSNIVLDAVKTVPRGSRLLIVTNPPHQIAKGLRTLEWDAVPFGLETDNLRASFFGGEVHGSHEDLKGNGKILKCVKFLNEETLKKKGFTQYTPGFALAKRILKEVRHG